MTSRYDEIGNRLKAFRLASGLSADEMLRKSVFPAPRSIGLKRANWQKSIARECWRIFSASPIEKFSPSARFRLASSRMFASALQRSRLLLRRWLYTRAWPKICGDVRSADRRRPNISDGACRARRRIVPQWRPRRRRFLFDVIGWWPARSSHGVNVADGGLATTR